MISNKQCVDLTPQEIAVIQSALQTQEKILSVQSRANGDETVRARLGELKRVLKSLRRHSPDTTRQPSWSERARALFG